MAFSEELHRKSELLRCLKGIPHSGRNSQGSLQLDRSITGPQLCDEACTCREISLAIIDGHTSRPEQILARLIAPFAQTLMF